MERVTRRHTHCIAGIFSEGGNGQMCALHDHYNHSANVTLVLNKMIYLPVETTARLSVLHLLVWGK